MKSQNTLKLVETTKTIQVNMKLKPICDTRNVKVTNLTQEEIDNKEGLLEYIRDYHCPWGFEVTDIEVTNIETK